MIKQNIQYLEIAKLAALSAGEYLANNFGIKHLPKFKSTNDVGLAVDIESEKIILNILQQKYPKHNYYLEELGKIENGSQFTWFIDPLDGTNNYFAGISYFSISIALLHNDEIIVGIIYNPISKQLFEATKNGGAFLNGKRVYPSQNSDLEKSVCSFIQGHNVANIPILTKQAEKIKANLAQKFRRIISTWSPALDWALLAFGGIDCLISFESELEDMYAGIIIAQESGVEIQNFEGEKFKIGDARIISSNNQLKKDVLELINLTQISF